MYQKGSKGFIKSAKGENAPSAKRHEKEILEIFNSKERVVDICKKYKIDRSLVWAIKVGKQWGSVTGMPKYQKQFFL